MKHRKYPYVLRVYMDADTSVKLAAYCARQRLGKSVVASACVRYALSDNRFDAHRVIETMKNEITEK